MTGIIRIPVRETLLVATRDVCRRLPGDLVSFAGSAVGWTYTAVLYRSGRASDAMSYAAEPVYERYSIQLRVIPQRRPG